MEIWVQRERFKKLVKEYRGKHDIDRETMADRLGITESYLHGCLYDKRVTPSLDVVQKAAELFEVSITELIDDPGSAPPGVETDRWAKATARDRAFVAEILEDLMGIPEKEKGEFFKLWKQCVTISRFRK